MRFLLNSRLVASSSRAFPQLRRHAFSTVLRQTARRESKQTRSPLSPVRLHDATLELQSKVAQEQSRGRKPKPNKTFVVFQKLVLSRLDNFLRENGWSKKKDEYTVLGVNSSLSFDHEAMLFRHTIVSACEQASEQSSISRKQNPFFWSLRNAFVTGDVPGLEVELKYAFQCFLMRARFTPNILATHQDIADMRFPYEWFPATRALQRTIHLHVGPTNSGKTYNALKALENANSGIYAGPLRLLAHEVYTRFLAKGKSCALVTGEEQRIPKDVDVYFKSCTVEMTPLNHQVDVAVIDEIQMIGDADRGWAWTQAFLGVQAKEVHLCGEERAVELIQSLCATIGDECKVTRYKRLSGLETMSESLNGDLGNLQKGDALVSFTRIGIHSLKNQIEKQTGKRCAIVYGSLPPEIRAHQAALFNDPNNDYDYLVASDAIGMGLNLEIRRVIFEATHKRDGSNFRTISPSEIKQIGGRAGRYRTVNQAIQATASKDEFSKPETKGPGLVTALEDEDLAIVIQAFNANPQPLETAGVQPPTSAIERLSTYFPPNTPLSFILLRFRDIARISSRFHMCKLHEMLEVADLIQPFPMSIYDRCVFLNAPVALRERNGPRVLQTLAKCVSTMQGGNLLEIREIDLELLDKTAEDMKLPASDYLRQLESLHKSITLYLWLSYRFTGVFTSQHLAFHVKSLLETKINDQLAGFNQSLEARRRRIEAARRAAELAAHRAENRRREQEQLIANDSSTEHPVLADTA
ncbi:P-loop containing nucleoside triphosphate hydrolase protein [Xylaria intraflava]|nr:P-loop containing nucleoside triphosphate hydrolase protein [Xylaria intraflava]